jgi:hypothetical protein
MCLRMEKIYLLLNQSTASPTNEEAANTSHNGAGIGFAHAGEMVIFGGRCPPDCPRVFLGRNSPLEHLVWSLFVWALRRAHTLSNHRL